MGAYECSVSPLRSGDKRGVFSCGGTLERFCIFLKKSLTKHMRVWYTISENEKGTYES